MDQSESHPITNIPNRAILGPLCLLFSLSLLYLQQSHLSVSLTAVALLGLMLCWKWEKNGLSLALLALICIDGYQLFFSDDSLTFWEFGLSASLAIAFITTTLAKTEISEMIEEQAQEKIEAIQSEVFSLKEILQKYERALKDKIGKIEALEQIKISSEAHEAALREKDAVIAELRQSGGSVEFQETLKRYENAIQEKNIIIDELHERLDKIDSLNGSETVSSKDMLKHYEEALQEKVSIITGLQEKIRSSEEQIRNLEEKSSQALQENDILSKALIADKELSLIAAANEWQAKNAANLALLQEKDREIVSLAMELQNKNAANQALIEEKETLSRTLLQEKEQNLAALAKGLKDKEAENLSLLEEKDFYVKELQEKATLNHELLKEKEGQLIALSKDLQEKDAAILALLAEKENSLNCLSKEFQEKEALNQVIVEKEQLLAVLAKELQEKDSAHLALLGEKELFLISLAKAVEEKDAAFADQQLQLADIKNSLKLKADLLGHSEKQLSDIQSINEEFQNKANEKIKSLENEISHLLSNLRNEKDHNATLEQKIRALQEEISIAKKQDEILFFKDKKIQQLEDSYKTLRDQVKEHEGFNFSKLLEKDRLIERNAGKMKELEEETQKKITLLDNQEKKIKDLTGQIEDLVEKLKHIESEKEELEKTISNKEPLAKSLARTEGMYRQLREQFDEKTKVLNNTRKELFHVEEEKNILEMNYLEETKYDQTEVLTHLNKYILDLTQVVESQEEEIELLQEIVANGNKL